MKIQYVVAVCLSLLIGSVFAVQLADAAPTRNNRAGAQLTYAINGSLRYVGSVTTPPDAGEEELTGWEDGAMAYTWCDAATNQINLKSDAGAAVITQMVPVAASTLYPVGVLRAGAPVVTVTSQVIGVSANCRSFVSE